MQTFKEFSEQETESGKITREAAQAIIGDDSDDADATAADVIHFLENIAKTMRQVEYGHQQCKDLNAYKEHIQGPEYEALCDAISGGITDVAWLCNHTIAEIRRIDKANQTA